MDELTDELSDTLVGEGDLAAPEDCLTTGTYEDVGEETVVTVDSPLVGGTCFFGDCGCTNCCFPDIETVPALDITSGGTNDVSDDVLRGVGTYLLDCLEGLRAYVTCLEGLLPGVTLLVTLLARSGTGVHDDD